MADAVAARVAVTGVNGFVGRHLAAELAGHAVAVVGIGMDEKPDPALDGLLDEYVVADLVEGWPDIGNVDAVIHLAGLAAVGPSFDEPQHYITVNSSIVTNLCESVLASGSHPRVVMVSSGAIYDGNQQLPLTEESAIAFNSPYAVSKVLNESQAAYYRGRGLDCVIARPFNHIGPGQGPGFLLPDLAAALEPGSLVEVRRPPAAEASKPPEEEALVSRPRPSAPQPAASRPSAPQPATRRPSAPQPAARPLKVGDLTTRRDYTDVRDVARAYRMLATQPHLSHDIYNICSGRSLAGNDILTELLKASGLSPVDTEIDESRRRPNDPADIVGDNSRLREDTGWSPTLSIDETVADFLAAR